MNEILKNFFTLLASRRKNLVLMTYINFKKSLFLYRQASGRYLYLIYVCCIQGWLLNVVL